MSRGSITFIGRASICIELDSGKVIYVDPYAGDALDYQRPADLVLVTHQHDDHNQIQLVRMKDKGKVIQCPLDIKEGDEAQIGGIKVKAVAAYNKNHPRESCCGFMIMVDGMTIYHAGDTSKIDEMEDLKDETIDYALLCMDDFYNMGPEEAMEVADLLKPKVVVPIHSSPQELFDQGVVDRFIYDKTSVLKPGEQLIIE